MSKMKDIDVQIVQAQAEMVESLAQWILDIDPTSFDIYDKDAWINVLQAWFDGTELGSCEHDWVGEALCRREECSALITQRELGDDLTRTGVDDDAPDNGYVALNMNRDTHLRYSTLDALITDTDLDAKGIEAFWSDHEVFELGKNIAKPKLKVIWGDDDGY